MSYDIDVDYLRQVCKKILENNNVLSEEKLPTYVKLPDSLLDENVNITLIEEYCAGNTFIKLRQLVKEKPKHSAQNVKPAQSFWERNIVYYVIDVYFGHITIAAN